MAEMTRNASDLRKTHSIEEAILDAQDKLRQDESQGIERAIATNKQQSASIGRMKPVDALQK
jgi:hypothetical protein